MEQLNRGNKAVDDIRRYKIQNLIDWPKSEFSAYIFGGLEPPGRFFTSAHEFVIIDSERMFLSGPSSFYGIDWLKNTDGSPSKSGLALSINVCRDIASLSRELIASALYFPPTLQIDVRWPVEPLLRESIRFSSRYLEINIKN